MSKKDIQSEKKRPFIIVNHEGVTIYFRWPRNFISRLTAFFTGFFT